MLGLKLNYVSENGSSIVEWIGRFLGRNRGFLYIMNGHIYIYLDILAGVEDILGKI